MTNNSPPYFLWLNSPWRSGGILILVWLFVNVILASSRCYYYYCTKKFSLNINWHEERLVGWKRCAGEVTCAIWFMVRIGEFITCMLLFQLLIIVPLCIWSQHHVRWLFSWQAKMCIGTFIHEKVVREWVAEWHVKRCIDEGNMDDFACVVINSLSPDLLISYRSVDGSLAD